MIITVGMITGAIVEFWVNDPSSGGGNEEDNNLTGDVAASLLSFSPTTFFIVLLPPIIFNSGYHVRRDLFFRYITPICLYACLGTAICTMVVGGILYIAREMFTFEVSLLELLAFGALISATDPVSTLAVFSSKKVDPHLFYLVFGESVVNDAVGLVLFEALAHLIENHTADDYQLDVGAEVIQFLFDFFTGFIGSLVLGTLFGLAVAYLLKRIDMRSSPLLELCVYVTIMYFPFVVAEILRLSGIVTVLFTGIAAQRYATPNLSPGTAQNADTVFRLMAHLTETIIFLELGLSVAGLVGTDSFHLVFIGIALLACLVGRFFNIYPITFAFNTLCVREKGKEEDWTKNYVEDASEHLTITSTDDHHRSSSRIPLRTAHMLWFSGLRGAVSYALLRTFPETGNQNTFVVTTMFVVMVTTFGLGGLTEYALQKLNIPMDVDEAAFLNSLPPKRLLAGFLGHFEGYQLRRWVIRDFDRRYRPESMKVAGESDNVEYQEHFEITEDDYINSTKSSVYDYGFY
jgi:sodium/hydrogen exchanger 8